MSPVAVPADRRFHRAHVKPARKRGALQRRGWFMLAWAVLAALLAVTVYKSVMLVADGTVFRVEEIRVRGNNRLPAATVVEALGDLRGQNILRADLEAWRARLMTSPWIRDVAFRRALPSTVEVTVTEREPIGVGRKGDELYLVDERGAVIDAYGPKYAEFDLPIIDGLVENTQPGAQPDPATGDLAARLILALRTKPNLARRLSQVDVTNPHNAAVTLSGDRAVIQLGEDRFVERLESYLDLAEALRARVADFDYVDLRFDERIYVRPAGTTRRDTVELRRDGGLATVAQAAKARR